MHENNIERVKCWFFILLRALLIVAIHIWRTEKRPLKMCWFQQFSKSSWFFRLISWEILAIILRTKKLSYNKQMKFQIKLLPYTYTYLFRCAGIQPKRNLKLMASPWQCVHDILAQWGYRRKFRNDCYGIRDCECVCVRKRSFEFRTVKPGHGIKKAERHGNVLQCFFLAICEKIIWLLTSKICFEIWRQRKYETSLMLVFFLENSSAME